LAPRKFCEKQNQFVSPESLAFVISFLCRIDPHALANLFEDFHLHPESRTPPAALNLSAITILHSFRQAAITPQQIGLFQKSRRHFVVYEMAIPLNFIASLCTKVCGI